MIKKVQLNKEKDLADLTRLAVLLWPTLSADELVEQWQQKLLSKKLQFFIKYEEDNPVGFAQVSLRYDFVEGASSSPVAYLEGLYIKDKFRHKGYAKELIDTCIKWARDNKCTEIASSSLLQDSNSQIFHKSIGFNQVCQKVHFIKEI